MSLRSVAAGALAAGLVAGLTLAWPALRLVGARSREGDARREMEQTLAAEREIAALRSAVSSSLLSRPPDGDVAAAIQASLRDAGLSVQLLAEVSPQESASIQATDASSARWKRQSVTVRLQAMALPDIGSFLDRWRASHPEWSIVQIDLQASESRGSADAPSGGLFAPRLTLLTTYLDRAQP
jgi:hypothetical protein